MTQPRLITRTATIAPGGTFDVSALLKNALTQIAAACTAQNLSSGPLTWEVQTANDGTITFTGKVLVWPATETLAGTGV